MPLVRCVVRTSKIAMVNTVPLIFPWDRCLRKHQCEDQALQRVRADQRLNRNAYGSCLAGSSI